jgi:predicted DCC family thiol-disulfide oxidoreductase YuxK
MTTNSLDATQSKPILLFNDKCGVCHRIAHWVRMSAQSKSGDISIIVRPIGDDPDALRLLNSNLDIWSAYAIVHVLMPDCSMKLGGEAVAEVLRRLPKTRWFAWIFALNILGYRPFQAILDLAYTILADIRPLFGCDSCGTPSSWVTKLRSMIEKLKSIVGLSPHPIDTPHFTARAATQSIK